MSQPVIIENDQIRMEVWPHIGGKVASVFDKFDKFDLLFDYPVELPTGAEYDIPFDQTWYAGWDECFPAVAPGLYPGHPYHRIAIPDHGELWGLPTTAVPTKNGITTVWHGLRFGYRLTRKLFLDGSSIRANYTLINLAPFEFRFVWAMHALMNIASPVRLEFPNQSFQLRDGTQTGSDSEGEPKHFAWPTPDANLDLSELHALPVRQTWMAFSIAPISAPVVVQYPARSRSLSIAYSSEHKLAAYWRIWINTGGWGGNRNFAVAPVAGRFDALDQSVTDGSAGSVGPLGRCEWSVQWTLS